MKVNYFENYSRRRQRGLRRESLRTWRKRVKLKIIWLEESFTTGPTHSLKRKFVWKYPEARKKQSSSQLNILTLFSTIT